MNASSPEWADAGLGFEVVDGVAWLRLNRPEKRNAVDRRLRQALLAAVHEVAENPAGW
jgi:2-(1,2-epoxy-1,2-dihydrophenyl)acetyl-CoA isomerase